VGTGLGNEASLQNKARSRGIPGFAEVHTPKEWLAVKLGGDFEGSCKGTRWHEVGEVPCGNGKMVAGALQKACERQLPEETVGEAAGPIVAAIVVARSRFVVLVSKNWKMRKMMKMM